VGASLRACGAADVTDHVWTLTEIAGLLNRALDECHNGVVRRVCRPGVGWLVAISVIGMYAFVSVLAAGFLTAAIVAVLQPAKPIWMILLVTLSVTFTAVGLRRYSPRWYAWLLGRRAQRPDPN